MFKVRPKILIFTIALFGLLSFYVLKFTHKDHMPSSVVTEYILTPFGYPHPYLLSFVAQYRFVHQVGEFLVRRDNHQNIVGGLASSWKISEDRRKITFNLRPDLYNAHEVAQSLNRLIRAGQTSHSNLAAQTDPSKVRVLNDLTLEIETIGDAGAILSPLVMADAVILPDDHWIQVEGFKDPQVDWTKTKGPYIYVSGKFPAGVNEPILFKPNPKHYFYDAKSVDWRLIYRPLDSISSLTELDNLLKSSPAFTTVRYTEQNKLFFTPDPGLAFYETRPNGICFLMPNLKSAVLKSRDARLAILKNIRSAVFPTLRKDSRADQIPQPGLSGRLSSEDFAKLVERTEKSAAHKFERPVVWLQSTAAGANPDLVASVAKAAGVPFTLKPGPDNPLREEWKKGDYD
ncbi:MAG: ABC transporter substrate-binding protein, partial [Bdellovibrionales bacterium]